MDLWKQLDKGRHQLKQPQHTCNRNQKSVVDLDQSPTKQQTDPIQSIANVLNHHSKFVQRQKKSQQLEEQSKNKLDQSGDGAAGSGFQQQAQIQKSGPNNTSLPESNLSFSCSRSSNQVDQGNSYLYAYNDFVTSNRGFDTPDISKLNFSSTRRERVDDGGKIVTSLCGHNSANLQIPNYAPQEETLIDSDEDDALSYILHQHRPHLDIIHDIQCPASGLDKCHFSSRNQLHKHYSEEGVQSFDAQRIDHHLSCSRSSHPRHICGIGGSHNAKLNNIAARLREESQRAFVLNQRSRNNYPDQANQPQTEDIADHQTHQFTHELSLIQNQILNNPISISKYASDESFLNSNSELLFTTSAIENCATDRRAFVFNSGNAKGSTSEIILDSTSSSEQCRPTLLNQERANSRREKPGFFSWLFSIFCGFLFCASSTDQQLNRINFAHNPGDARKRRHKKWSANESTVVGMYSSSQHLGGGSVGQLGGQAGAYFVTQTPQTDAMHQSYANHAHQTHSHQYPLSSDSSLGSSAFANSALRMNAFFRNCCSKKCLFISCFIILLLIFICVIGLSAYLNFLINSSKTNLTPLSGRLKVETQGDSFVDQLSNRTSKEFLAKQQQYETILRGAFDRTQALLKSYPNHLVKCEVYSFKQGSLWVYFRLFINKKTLMRDTQLMKRKSPDESLDKQFLPRLTQQTLHSGFEQLISSFRSETSERQTRSSQATNRVESKSGPSTQRDHVRSFDDQISRLMPIVESIDLQSIQVTPEFDMLSSVDANAALQQQSMSDNLRASQFITTASSAIMVATGSGKNLAEYDVSLTTTESLPNSSTTPTPSSTPRPAWQSTTENAASGGGAGEISVSTKKFTLYGYKENATRPVPTTVNSVEQNRQRDQQESPFLINVQQRKPVTTNGPSLSRANGPFEITNRSSNARETAQPRPSVESQASALKERVVQLVSGQPVVSQNSLQRSNINISKNSDDKAPTTERNITLFAPLPKPDNAESGRREGSDQRSRIVNETVVMQMVAPYQKIDFSSRQPNNVEVQPSSRRPVQDFSVEKLWNDALNNSNKRNISLKIEKSESHPKRLITITTVGGGQNNVSGTNVLDWNKTPLLSSDNSETTHALANSSSTTRIPSQTPSTEAATTLPSQSSTMTPQQVSSQKPKISPHLKQGGSIISIPSRQQDSAILLNRDIQQPSNEGQISTTTINSTQAAVRAPQSRPEKQQRKPHGNGQRNVTSSGQRTVKPTIKHQKPKKVLENSPSIVKNDSTNGTLINSKGIRIVDNFLATIDSTLNKTTSTVNQNFTLVNLKQNKNKTQEAYNFNADQIAPTLPTTIELTRSTTANPPVRTTNLQLPDDSLNNHRAASNVDYTTTTSSTPPTTSTTELTTEGPSRVTAPLIPRKEASGSALVKLERQQSNGFASSAHSNQVRPGTSSFSSQWRPIPLNITANSTTDETHGRNRTIPRRPNSPILLAAERPPPNINVPSNQGSQSPFAMSTAILESQLKPTGRSDQAQSPPRRTNNNRLSNTYVISSGIGSGNEFESHRMSRMRQGESQALNSLTQTLSTSTTSSLNMDSNTRIVDDFMITTDKIEGNARGTTLIPPVILNNLDQLDPIARIKASNPIEVQPKRTKGPFVFETLKALNTISPIDSNLAASSDVLTSRPERSPTGQGVDQKLLVRKKLFLGNGEDDEINPSPTTNPPVTTDGAELRFYVGSNSVSGLNKEHVDRFGNRIQAARDERNQTQQQILGENLTNAQNYSFRCQYYGCRAKGKLTYTCLNYTQICDDFIDCHDESDELDCVSLLKHDSQSNKLSFSNGAGIIYLNRRGSLAPMCIDYFMGPEARSGPASSVRDLSTDQFNLMKKHQELIRQINTIGQYACSLQSFSRLVSVKINHHNLVDGLNLIKTSKLYHRLSIAGDSDRRDKV